MSTPSPSSSPLEMASNTAPTQGSFALYKRLLGYLRPLRVFFLLGIFGFVIFSAASIWFFDLLQELVDTINSGVTLSPQQRLHIPLTLILIVSFRGIGGFLGPYYMAYIANYVVHQVRTELMDRFVDLPSSYYDRNTTAHLLSTVTFNVTQISAAVSDALTVILREGILVIALFSFLLYLNWKLTLMFVIIMPVISVVVVYASKKFRKHSHRIQLSMGDVTHILSETLKGMKVVKTFSAENQVREKFREASERNLKQNLKMILVQSISTPIIQVLVASALSVLLWLAMSPAVLETISPGEFVTYIVVAGSMLKPIRQLSKINSVVQKGLAAAQSIFLLLDEETETDQGRKVIDTLEGRVEFRDVCFAYVGAEGQVLNNISFSCEAGKTIAIVGKSGSGKSTLVNLVPRFYQQSSGEILLDGINSKDITLHSLRRQIALVSQQVVLFNGSVRENIAYGELRNVSDEKIREALVNANALGFVEELTDGLDTHIGDDGFLLSGGQRQRLAIARALLKNAPILILDEATSALDSESESAIQLALETLMQGRTTFVIAHRLSTIESADMIIVLDKGRIVESGTHQELLASGGHYKQLHQLQFS